MGNDVLEEREDVTLKEASSSTVDDILREKLQRALHQLTYEVQVHEMAKIASEHNAIDLAYAVSTLPQSASLSLFENLSENEKVSFLINIPSSSRSYILRHLEDVQLVPLLEKMPMDEAVWVLDDVSDRKFRRLIKLIDAQKATSMTELRSKDCHSAARLMVNDFLVFSAETSMGEVKDYIHQNPHIEMTRRVFVMNEEGQLQGFVPDRNLIVNPPSLQLKQVMRPISHTVGPEATREEVIDVVERYKIPALPVVNSKNELIGVICYEDVVEALEDIADETIASIAGTNEHIGEYEPRLKRFLARAPWLFVTLVAGLVNAFSMSYFENQEGVLLAFVLFFVPLITGMSGNIGIQSSTILVRGMATGALTTKGTREAVVNELIVGFGTGVFFGIITGILVYLLDISSNSLIVVPPAMIGIIVSCGLFGACLVGTLLGVFSPLFFSKIGVDPAVASGPIVTAFNDFFSMIIYFLIAWGLGNLFF
ncbi:MAG: Magnesium transporter MgtE [Chlamydiae bacterium]|nr:Magnesium transporter MgtE [Chlamydiota bacterium]